MTLRLGAAVAMHSDAMRYVWRCPRKRAEADVRQALQAWLQAQARSVIGERLERFSERMQCALCRLAVVVGAHAMGIVFARWSRSTQLASGAFRAAGH